MWRDNRELTARLVRIAHKIIDAGNEQDGDEILETAHEIAGRSLTGNVPPNDLMAGLALFLENQKVEWAVIGAIAVYVHGTPRDTNDIDVLVSSMPDSRSADPRYMERFGFYRSRSSTGTVQTIDSRAAGQVELLLANDAIRQAAILSAQPQTVLGRQVPVVDAAHLIALKAAAWTSSPARGAKDRTDIVSVWEKSRPNLSPVLGLLSPKELANLKLAIPDAFEDVPPEQ